MHIDSAVRIGKPNWLTRFPQAGISKLGFTISFFVAVFFCLSLEFAGCAAVLGASEAHKRVGGAEESLPFGELEVLQKLSLAVGTLQGDKTEFLRYEEMPLPSLNPDLALTGRVKFRLDLPNDVRAGLQVALGEKTSGSFGLGYRHWDLEYGPQAASFKRAGLEYSRSIEGLRLDYRPAPQFPNLEVFSARTSSRFADVTFKGDDSFGPHFLGHKDLVAQSEQVFVNARRLERGEGPGEGDYYLDYKGGFLYFNRIVLAHETVRVFYEHFVDIPGLSSVFRGAVASYSFATTTANVFLLQDHVPLDQNSILQDSGSTLRAYGANLQSVWDSGARLDNTLLFTDLNRYYLAAKSASQELIVEENVLVYILGHAPILYQSERVFLFNGDREELMRNLDYVLDYQSGELTFMFEPDPGSKVLVEYTHLTAGEIAKTETLQGMQSTNRFQYADDRWRTNTWLEATWGEFVSVRTQQQSPDKFSAGTSTEYYLDENWSLLANINALGRSSSTVIQPAVGGRFRNEHWDTSLQLAGDFVENEGQKWAATYLKGSLKRQALADLKLDFKKQLSDSEGVFPDNLEASAAGLLGEFPFTLSYTHGDEHYADKIEARLVLPAQGEHKRGLITIASQHLYKEGFSSRPRKVYSLAGNFALNPPSGVYLRAQGSFSSSRLESISNNTYSLNVEAGCGLGKKTVLDYQLRLNGSGAEAETDPVGSRSSRSQIITLAAVLTEQFNAALVYRNLDSFRRRFDGGSGTQVERGLQAALLGQLGSIEAALIYDRSKTEADSPAGTHLKEIQRTRLTLDWKRDDLSVKGAVDLAVHDGWRRRLQLDLTPTLRLSADAELWFGYSRIVSRDLSAATEMYKIHLLKTGITFRL